MEQTIFVMEVIQEVWEAENGEPDWRLEDYLEENFKMSKLSLEKISTA